MKRTRPGATFLVACSLIACGSTSSGGGSALAGPSPSSPVSPRAHWLVGTWSNLERVAHDVTAEAYSLKADGTGKLFRTTVRGDLPYGTGDTNSQEDITWSSDGYTLTIGSLSERVVATSNCRMLMFDTKVYSRSPHVDDCPLGMPALTETESAFVGKWSFQEPRSDTSESPAHGYLTLETDRHLRFFFAPRTSWNEPESSVEAEDYWSVDPDGTLHGMTPEGSEELTLRLSRAGDQLTVCMKQCVVMHPAAD